MKVEAPDEFRYWCRTCLRMTWHWRNRHEYLCEDCDRAVQGSEMVLMFSTSETFFGDKEKLLVPFRLLTKAERWRLGNPKQPKTLRGKEES